ARRAARAFMESNESLIDELSMTAPCWYPYGVISPRAVRPRLGVFSVLCAIFGLAASTAAPAQNTPDTMSPSVSATAHRPRIGLVLSGGGARGIAHIGVLKVLEEQ